MPPTPAFLSPDVLTPSATRARIEDLDAQIMTLKTSLRDLKSERQSLKTHLDAFIYPVLTLPNEIVSEVFLYSSGAVTSPVDPASPLFLGHICQRWRDIALNTPSLWTRITLNLEAVTSRESQLRLLETWLLRSRDCMLCIGLHQQPSVSTILLGRDSLHERCLTLSLVLPHADIFRIDGEFPSLLCLLINFSDLSPNSPPDPSWPVKVFHQAPKLRALVMGGRFHLNLPWAQITMLANVSVPFVHDLTEVLVCMVNLETLDVAIISASDDEIMANIAAIPPLVQLRRLDLGDGSDPKACMQLLEKLTLPALSEFRLSGFCFTPSAIQNLLARSRCHLPSLCITIADAELSAGYYRLSLPSVGSVVVKRAQSDDTDASEESADDS
ncbi:hypothetical protein DFH09DRAFT_1181741 [Mycena vulgaris]|nr:hypothetical protein DFH09DRAFT_1181741 [Mycena vulgaris]